MRVKLKLVRQMNKVKKSGFVEQQTKLIEISFVRFLNVREAMDLRVLYFNTLKLSINSFTNLMSMRVYYCRSKKKERNNR